MAMAHLPMRGKLYNVVAQLLKFLLMPLAVYEITLSSQLHVKLPATLSLVDATPGAQQSQDRAFNVAFYGLHFFSTYHDLLVRVSLVQPDGERQLTPKSFQKKEPPFYSTQFSLPDSPAFPRGKYTFHYEVAFDGRDDHLAKMGKDYVFDYEPGFPCKEPIYGGPLSVRKGQRVALPTEWEGMDLVPFTNVKDVAIETHDNRKWLKVQPSLVEEKPEIWFQSLMFVTNVDEHAQSITTRSGQTQNAGPTIYWSDKESPLVCSVGESGTGTQIEVKDIKPNYRIAFITRTEEARRLSRIIVVAPANQKTRDVRLNLVVSKNEPPRSAYPGDEAGIVSLFTSWLFWDSDSNSYFFDMNRYLIDPDGRNAQTNEPDIRVTSMNYDSGADPRFRLQRPDPNRQIPDFQLHLNRPLAQIFQGKALGEFIEVPLIVTDEVNRVQSTIRIFRDK